MTIFTLDDYCHAINHAQNIKKLSGIRSRLQGLLKDENISIAIYRGLNQDIRERADRLKRRK
jgi:hypothetical protein